MGLHTDKMFQIVLKALRCQSIGELNLLQCCLQTDKKEKPLFFANLLKHMPCNVMQSTYNIAPCYQDDHQL